MIHSIYPEINNIATVDKIKNLLLDILFPRFCLGCGKEETYLCDDCKSILDISEHRYCLCDKNALRLPPQNKTGKCNKCSSKKLSGIYFALSYREKPLIRKLIHFLKYEPYYLKDLAEPLASLIIDHFNLSYKDPKEILKSSVLVPVPLDRKKLKRRGYNQSEELAKELAKKLEIPLILNNLVKIKETEPQMELQEKERRENLKGAFLCQKPDEIRQLAEKGKKIFLIDDVYTTGSTMEECTLTLKRAGAKEIWGIVAARD